MLALSGCASLQPQPLPRTADESKLFGPVSMKLDSFSKIKSLSDGSTPDGVEALVEFDDQFGDRTKASGALLFELFDYRAGWADPRGERVANPWTGSLRTVDDQKAHWERASGAYTFKLAYGGIHPRQSYVLAATFESAAGGRFFSQIVLQPGEASSEPTADTALKPEIHAEPTTIDAGTSAPSRPTAP